MPEQVLAGRSIAIVSRLYAPEPAAASFRLRALARALRAAGARVTVLTTRPPAEYGDGVVDDGVEVRRAPVLRDRDGYVRGYLQYLSFDVPAFVRMLGLRGVDLVIHEPPPTTGLVTRVAAALRRRPYVSYAADIWSDAVASTTAPGLVQRVVRALEIGTWRRAAATLSVSAEVTERLAELGVTRGVTTIGNGVDTEVFAPDGDAVDLGHPYLLYAGTASEVHGAGIFLDAAERLIAERPDLRIVFVGQGADRADLERRAEALGPGVVRFEPRVPSTEVARWTRGAVATLASVHPDGYRLAMATKMFASVACGTPVVYAGEGPGREFAARPGVGWGVDYDADALAGAMRAALDAPRDPEARARLAEWARREVSLDAVGDRAVAVVADVLARRGR